MTKDDCYVAIYIHSAAVSEHEKHIIFTFEFIVNYVTYSHTTCETIQINPPNLQGDMHQVQGQHPNKMSDGFFGLVFSPLGSSRLWHSSTHNAGWVLCKLLNTAARNHSPSPSNLPSDKAGLLWWKEVIEPACLRAVWWSGCKFLNPLWLTLAQTIKGEKRHTADESKQL